MSLPPGTDRPFKLPERPIDCHEVKWWRIDRYDAPVIIAMRAVYHVNTPWRAIYPDGRSRGFVDDWQIFNGESFTGRCCGWSGMRGPWVNVFADEADAVARAIAISNEAIRGLESTLARYVTNRVDLERRLAKLAAATR